jgi:hypothetical protein
MIRRVEMPNVIEDGTDLLETRRGRDPVCPYQPTMSES